MNRQTLGIIVTVFGAIIYGAYPAAIRAVYEDQVSVIFVMLVTTWARVIGLTAFCLAKRKPLFASRAETKIAVTGGFFQSLSITGICASLLYLPAPLVICIVFTQTLMQLFFMVWRGEAKMDLATLVSTIMALLGLTIVLDVWHPQQNIEWIGIGLASMAAIVTTCRMYLYGKQTKTRHPIVVGAESFLTAGVILLPALLLGPITLPHTTEVWLWLGIACLSMIGGTFCMFTSIGLIGSFSYSMFAKLEPIFTAIFAVLFIHEVLQWHQYAGILIVVASLVAYQFLSSRMKPDA
jgi:drug/metabolite transporter (DMT)-like permease